MSYQNHGQPPYGSGQYSYPPNYGDAYAQPQQYQPTPPQIHNPFAPPPVQGAYNGKNSGYDPEHEAQVAQWQSAYIRQDKQDKDKKGSKVESVDTSAAAQAAYHANTAAAAAATDGEKKKTVVRKGGGQTWEDSSLLEWDPTQFRIMVGNLAGEVTDESLAKAFTQYGVSKARVVRDKRTTKSKGYGFVSFIDGEQGFKAAREMAGKYIGSHPVTIQRSKTDLRPVAQKDNKHNKNKNKNKNKPDKKKDEDPLRAHTGAHIEKKPVKSINGMKMLG